MEREGTIQGMGKRDDDFFSHICPDDQRPYFLTGLWNVLFKIMHRFFADAIRVFFQHIQKTIRVVVSVSVIYDRNLDDFYLIVTGFIWKGIMT